MGISLHLISAETKSISGRLGPRIAQYPKLEMHHEGYDPGWDEESDDDGIGDNSKSGLGIGAAKNA